MKTHLALLLVFGLALIPGAARAQPNPMSTGDLIEDARLIITSDRGDLRLWRQSPNVHLVTTNPDVARVVQRIMEEVNAAVRAPFAEGLFGSLSISSPPTDLGRSEERIWMRLRKSAPTGGGLNVKLAPGENLNTDILVAVADRPTLAMLNGLWGLQPNFNRSQLEGNRAGCFYSARSRNGALQGAYVTISADLGPERIETCLWEELLHTLGILTDAQRSPFFSFDNLPNSSLDRRAADLALVRALYESGATPGGDPQVALDFLGQILAP